MAYTPTNWKTGDVITAEKLNNMESGIADCDTAITGLKEDLNGWSDDTKTALLNCFAHVAWTDEHGQDYYDALEEALYAEDPPTPKTLVSISAVYTQSGNIYNTDSLDRLKEDLVVTATYDDSTTATITAYTLSGTLEVGTSTITATYEGKTATFTVTVKSGFLYTPDKGILSDQDYITTSGTGTVSETIVNDTLRLYAQMASSDAGFYFDFTPSTFTTSAKLKVELKIAQIRYLASNNTTSQGYTTFRISDGTNGASYGYARYNTMSNAPKGRVLTSSSSSWVDDISLDTWHTIEIDCTTAKQTITVDGVKVVDNADVQTLWLKICRFIVYQTAQADNDLYIKSIEFEVN